MTPTERITLHIACAIRHPLRSFFFIKGIIREFIPSPYQKHP